MRLLIVLFVCLFVSCTPWAKRNEVSSGYIEYSIIQETSQLPNGVYSYKIRTGEGGFARNNYFWFSESLGFVVGDTLEWGIRK